MTEFFKTALIFLLTLSMIFLLVCFFVVTVASDALSPGDLLYEFSLATGDKAFASGQDEKDLQPAAFPCQISFLSGMGELYMPISYQEYSEALENTEQIFEEAIGSAYDKSPSSELEYLSMLLGQGVLCVYDYPVPFYMLCQWADYEYTGEDINVSVLYICEDNDSVRLLVRDDQGSYHSFFCQSDIQYLRRICSSVSPNGRISAITNSLNTASDVPILSGGINLPLYTVQTIFDSEDPDISREALSVLSINPYLTSIYRDGDTTIYIEESNRLHLYADGHLSYSVAENGSGINVDIPDGADEKTTVLAVTEQARETVFALWDELGDSRIQLSLSETEKDGDTYTVFFEAYIGGCYISMGDHAAAAVMVQDGKITNISIYPITLRRRTDLSLLPYTQAQAAAEPGAVLRVQYVLSDDMSLVPIIADVREGD